MTPPRRPRTATAVDVPADCWYAACARDTVGRDLLSIRAVNRSVVLFRTELGTVAALEDCCAHRPYPLSAGTLAGDSLRCGLCGFEYDATGQCVRVPTQSRVPIGAAVRAYPVREEHGLVWVWFGQAGRASLHRTPNLPWLDSGDWVSVTGQQIVAAGFLLLHESFADVTKIPVLAPEISPEVLHSEPPPLDVMVTETTVSLSRRFPPGLLPDWQARALGVDPEAKFDHRQEGHFHSPAAWVDHWDVDGAGADAARLRFTHLVTPIDARSSRLQWHVSRDFAIDDGATSARLADMFATYYGRLASALGVTQSIIESDGPQPEVNVSADVAALKVRGIVQSLLTEEGARSRNPTSRGRVSAR
jgi:phenylpropionate dioxygenase-like ring-hydroxylating dioxygenase large terminal subunit